MKQNSDFNLSYNSGNSSQASGTANIMYWHFSKVEVAFISDKKNYCTELYSRVLTTIYGIVRIDIYILYMCHRYECKAQMCYGVKYCSYNIPISISNTKLACTMGLDHRCMVPPIISEWSI